MLIRTDDEVYRVDAVWLGPPRATFPWRARYVSYGVGLIVMVLIMAVQRQLGIGLSFFSVAWALVGTIAITKFLGKKIDYERPLGQVLGQFWAEVTGPREERKVAGGLVRAKHVRVGQSSRGSRDSRRDTRRGSGGAGSRPARRGGADGAAWGTGRRGGRAATRTEPSGISGPSATAGRPAAGGARPAALPEPNAGAVPAGATAAPVVVEAGPADTGTEAPRRPVPPLPEPGSARKPRKPVRPRATRAQVRKNDPWRRSGRSGRT
ncbi:hypothetical protein [Pseudonocardia phyllosphaerae]|uniref:hypothetical protein n=1 Tax=Pseudonocardia phyllosphaerae TaxID=3390502 RepID=UPI00397DA153